MKFGIKNIFALLLVLHTSILTVSSHPGRTDANGGHYNRSTGEYHYHTGEYAGRTQNSSSTKEQSYSYTPQKEKIEIEIIEPADTYYAGRSYTFSARIPEDYSQEDIVWTVDDNEVAELSGAVLTLKKSGYIQITATLEDATDRTSANINDFYLVELLEKIAIWSIALGFLFFILTHIFSIFNESARNVSGCLTGIFICIIPLLAFAISALAYLFYKFYL